MAEEAIKTEGVFAGTLERPLSGLGKAAAWGINGDRVIWALPLLDALAIAVALALAYSIRFYNPWFPYYSDHSWGFYRELFPWVLSSWLAVFALYRLYDRRLLFGGTDEYAAVANACTVGIILVVFYDFVRRSPVSVLSRGWVLLFWVLSIVAVGASRFAFRRLVYHLRRQGKLSHRVLIVGSNSEAQLIAQQFESTPTAGVEVVGFVQDGQNPDSGKCTPVLGKADELKELVKAHHIREVLLVPSALDRETFLDIYRAFGSNGGDVQLSFSPGLFELFTTGVETKQVGFVPLINLNRLRITGLEAALKTIFDYSVAVLGLVLLAPLFLTLAVFIKLDSPGPVFHRRRVLGAGGGTFDALKFRTMVTNARQLLEGNSRLKEQYEENVKLKDDPRTTRAGRLLRRYSLDELPQLVNVLRGEMSLVGPRMITPEEQKRYGKWGVNLLTVKPGITGLWQVSGRSDVSYEERVRLDMYYIRNYTVWLDVRLLVQTVPAVLRGKGAY